MASPTTINANRIITQFIFSSLLACNTCYACVEACPIDLDPLSVIVALRRYMVMEESMAPAEWNGMFSNIENNGAPWQFSPSALS